MIDPFTIQHPIIIEEESEFYHEKEFLKQRNKKFNEWLDARLKERAQKIQEEANQC